MAVVALGGYARRELCPASDVDLLLLHDGWGRRDLSALVETLCYPLWDARLSVGHAVRTPAEAVADAGSRIDTATALLDRRMVAGDRGLFDGLSSRVAKWSRRNGTSLLRRLAGADEARHHEAGAHPGMLEPDLKNGAGGLRDIHSLRWGAGWLLGEMGLDPLVAAGYLSPDDRRGIAQANDVLLRVRCALHTLPTAGTGKALDVLRLDQQDEVAALLRPDADADALLREVGLAMRRVGHLYSRAWDLILADATTGRRRRRLKGRDLGGGVSINGGLVDLAPVDLRTDPASGLRAIAVAAEHGAHLSRSTATALSRQVTEVGSLPWDAAAREALLALLSAGDGVAAALGEADHVGLLSAYLPQWGAVRGRPQRNALHRFDLDSHGAEAVVALHSLRRDESFSRVWQRLPDTATLLLATWLHDIGKAWPGDHSQVGAQVAAAWLQDMGFEAASIERVALLIRHHLLLPDVATRRDLEDPDEIAAVAKTVGDVETLDALYLLTLADGRATGPAAWSPWKDNLIAVLHERARRHLSGSAVEAVDPREAAVAAGASRQEFAAISAIAPERFFDLVDVEQLRVVSRLLDGGEGRGVDVRPGRVAGTAVVTVVADDRPRLLADCAGVLAAADLEVVDARALTGEGGIALDWFIVTGHVEVTDLSDTMAAAAADRIDVASLVNRPRWGRNTPPVSRRAPRVVVRDDVALEVEAANTPALLYRLCGAIADAGYALDAVRAATLGPSVFDVFEVRTTDADGDLDTLRNQVLSALEGDI